LKGLEMPQYDYSSIHDFLMQTPEQGLRKMLVDGKTLTETHFQMLIKIARACNAEQFCNHALAGDFPKIRFSANETKLKEKLWKDCEMCLASRGLLSPIANAA
jgi:hypothetical protein